MRTFFLGDKILTRCGTSSGRGKGGIGYFCPSCAELWGRVETGYTDWAVLRIHCRACQPGWRNSGACGSFLRPLVWWDKFNGATLADQLNHADKSLLHYEALIHAEAILFESENLK